MNILSPKTVMLKKYELEKWVESNHHSTKNLNRKGKKEIAENGLGTISAGGGGGGGGSISSQSEMEEKKSMLDSA